MKVLRKTGSICPECKEIIPAEIFEKDGKVWIRKECKEHGEVEDLYYGDYEMYKKAESFAKDGKGIENPAVTKDAPICPKDCGLCKMHKSHTALANIAVTNRCDSNCWYCFYFAEKAGYVYEPTLEDIRVMVKALVEEKPVSCNALQLTGGNPELRDDLFEIVKIAKDAGIDHVQVNTQGTAHLAHEPDYAEKLRKSGVNTLYLSFDGVTPKTNPKNHWEIPSIFDNCRKADLGIVLVPTVIKGTNDHEVGDILRFGFRNIDVVRSVNMQPVSLVGRMPKKERARHRITIPDVIKRIEEQTDGQVGKEDFYPIPTITPFTNFVEAITKKPKYQLSSHFACGMATYIFEVDGKMVPLPQFVDVEGLLGYINEKAEELEKGKSRYLTGAKMLFKIRSFIDKEKQPKGFSLAKIIYNALVKHDYRALGKFHEKSLFVGMMHFMDPWNYDIERVKRCCIHYAMPNGRIIPFCTFNVMPEWYRDKDQKENSMSFNEYKEKTGIDIKQGYYKRDVEKLEATEAYRRTYPGLVR
jgi:uncharacterized radical SAM superfamily Fe-S cluster-containing enzyme